MDGEGTEGGWEYGEGAVYEGVGTRNARDDGDDDGVVYAPSPSWVSSACKSR